jgi:hypothetical protein
MGTDMDMDMDIDIGIGNACIENKIISNRTRSRARMKFNSAPR